MSTLISVHILSIWIHCTCVRKSHQISYGYTVHVYKSHQISLSNNSTAHLGMLSGLSLFDTLLSTTSKHIFCPLDVRRLFTFRSRDFIIPCNSRLLHWSLCFINFFLSCLIMVTGCRIVIFRIFDGSFVR